MTADPHPGRARPGRAGSGRSRRFLGFALRAAGVAALVAVAGWFFAPRWFASEPASTAVRAAVAGCAISLIASLAGGLLLAGRPADPQTAAVRALGATGLRLGVVAALVLTAGFGLGLALRPLLLWTAISYVALLALDTRFALSTSGAGGAEAAPRAEEVRAEEARAEEARAEPESRS